MRQAQAFLELTEYELQLDLTASDKTIVLKMYINKDLKDYASSALLAVWGFWGEIFMGKVTNGPSRDQLIELVKKQLNCMVTSMKNPRDSNGIKNSTKWCFKASASLQGKPLFPPTIMVDSGGAGRCACGASATGSGPSPSRTTASSATPSTPSAAARRPWPRWTRLSPPAMRAGTPTGPRR